MKQEEKSTDCCGKHMMSQKCHCHHNSGGSNAIYGLGVVGALFYFLQGAVTFTAIIIGICKAIFWPALLMFKVLTFLQM